MGNEAKSNSSGRVEQRPAASRTWSVRRHFLMLALLTGASPAFAQVDSSPAANYSPPSTSSDAATTASAAASPGGADATADIIVTARGREQRLQDVPVAVSVVTGASLQAQNINTLSEMAARLPDLKIASGTITNAVTIRGVGSGANAGFEQSVGTFVDGIYRSRSRSTTAALFDLDRVEVLKGPQTTFFGANAIAGALNIATRKPGTQFDYNGSLYFVPSTREYDGQFGVDLPLTDTLAVRLAGRLFGSNGYIKNDALDEKGPHNRAGQGRLAVRWEPTSGFRSDLRVEGSRSRNRNATPFQLTNCPEAPLFTVTPVDTCGRYLRQNGGVIDGKLDYHSDSGPNYVNYDYIETALTNKLDVGTGSISSVTGYFWHRYENQGQGVPFQLTDVVVGTDGYPTFQSERYRQFSQELRYQSAAGGTFEYMFGGYYEHNQLDSQSLVGFRFLPFGASDRTGTYNASSPLSGNINYGQTSRTLSAFASLTVRPIDHVRINLGARYSSIRKDGDRSVTPGLSSGPYPDRTFQSVSPANQTIIAGLLATNRNNFPITRRTDDKFMPSASIQYDIASNVMAYVSYSNGFKAGGYSFGANNEIFDPETVNAYEAGLKGSFFDRRLTGDITIYRSDYHNLQETSLQLQPTGAVTSLVTNVARSRSQGVEVSGTLRVVQGLTLHTSVAYLDAKYLDYPNGACTIQALATTPSCIQNLSGKRRSFAPEWSGNVGATFTAPIGSNRLTIDPLLYFTSSYFQSATADPLLEQSGNAKVDVRVSFGPANGHWQLSVIGKNLTNRTTAAYRQSIPLAPGSISALVDPPRTVGLQLTVRR